MRVIAVSAATAALLAGLAAAQQALTINTPSSLFPLSLSHRSVCIPQLVTWSGGSAPYYVTVNQGGSQSNVLETLVNAGTQTQYTWNVNLPAGTAVTLAVRDSTGATNFAQQVTIQQGQGASTSCLTATSSSGGAGASTTSSAPASTSSAPASTTTSAAPATTSTTSAAPVATSRSTSAAPAATSAPPSNAAAPAAGAAHAAGAAALALAAVAAALF